MSPLVRALMTSEYVSGDAQEVVRYSYGYRLPHGLKTSNYGMGYHFISRFHLAAILNNLTTSWCVDEILHAFSFTDLWIYISTEKCLISPNIYSYCL
ncbi:hypothetical protein TNCV_840591 [Trichonephila clavipes]|nr:hypothetical protein TNCV_840591 [Trichonephila clavipes]